MLGRIGVTLALGLVLSLVAGRSDAAGRRRAAVPAPASGEYDVLIENDRIIDGTGSPRYANEVRRRLAFQAAQDVGRPFVVSKAHRRRRWPAGRSPRGKAHRSMLVEQREGLILRCGIHAVPPERARS